MIQAPVGIQRMLPRHNKIMDLYLAGHDVKVIAETVGTSTAQVSMTINSPLFQHTATKRRAEMKMEEVGSLDRQAHMAKAQSILEQASEKAASTLEGLLESEDESIRFRGATAILDRALNSGKQNSGVVVNITAEQVQLLNLAMKESQYVNPVQPAHSSDASGSKPAGSVVCEERGVEDRPAYSSDADGSEV